MSAAFLFFKYSIFALLAFNIYLFFQHATFHEGIDCVGWLLLLIAFEWQTRKEQKVRRHRGEKLALIAAQLVAYALVLYAWGNYYLHGQWIDFINATLWLAVVLLLELDVYGHRRAWRRHWLHHAAKGVLYAGLIAVAVFWGVEGDILNFYDAFLWIVCFFTIELNLLQHVFGVQNDKDKSMA